MRAQHRRLALMLVAGVVMAGCGPSGAGGSTAAWQAPESPPPAVSPSPAPAAPASPAAAAQAPDLAAVTLQAVPVAELEAPTAMASRAGDDGLYIAERVGRVRVVRGGQLVAAPVLDISGQTTTTSERGLLGIAFSPAGDRLYVSHTDPAGDSRLAEYTVAGGAVDPASRRELLLVDQPYPNHNGGDVAVTPDGRVWLGLGDGGSSGDPQDNGQSLGTLLGKLLRIDPTPSATAPYSIPPDNPFVARQGARGEIWAYGMRNPWRFSFDRDTGDLWIADVGQNAQEEIDFAAAGGGAGANYGWNRLEGTAPFEGTAPPDAVAPLFSYPTSQGCAITGGYVYRGQAMPALRGAYLFGDYCNGLVRALVQQGGAVVAERTFDLEISQLVSFGQDAAGELYALSLEGGVYRLQPAD
jgi:glucose/arabinose dehydrogenase